jgi:N-acetylglucosamine kinase-like BadF-type ATPase
MDYVLGVDGGGSTIRVDVMTPDLKVCGQSRGATVNPNIVGRPSAMQTIQTAMREAIANAGLEPGEISAVGIGIGGAEAWHAEAWLREVVAGVLPHATVVPRSDHEIALVGAHGCRRGILVLSGTGSLTSGVGSSGDYILIGGLGYLLGDEGSGYWIGMEGLRAVMRSADGRGRSTQLTHDILGSLGLQETKHIARWVYEPGYPRNREVAELARLVLQQAENGDAVAQEIVVRAADELALATRALQHRLGMERLPIAFAGSLLTHNNPLSRLLCQLLYLDAIPLPKYPGTIGGAILAFEQMGIPLRNGD